MLGFGKKVMARPIADPESNPRLLAEESLLKEQAERCTYAHSTGSSLAEVFWKWPLRIYKFEKGHSTHYENVLVERKCYCTNRGVAEIRHYISLCLVRVTQLSSLETCTFCLSHTHAHTYKHTRIYTHKHTHTNTHA